MPDFLMSGAHGDKVACPVLVERDPLCVIECFDFTKYETVKGLYLIYLRKGDDSWRLGPFYASLTLAHRGMLELHAQFPKQMWSQPIEWLTRQASIKKWILENLGDSKDLIGGAWSTA